MNTTNRPPNHVASSPWAVLLCLFLLSVIIRLPFLDRPLSTNYEWVTAHTLVTLQIWFEEGITTHNFNPIYTFDNPNDHFINCPPSGVADSEGNHYYVSYPPFSFILPFLIFKVLGIYPVTLALQIFNLVFHFLCSVLIYSLLAQVASHPDRRRIYSPGIIAASIYLFTSSALWHHGNVYFADVLVQFFFILSTYALIILLKKKSQLHFKEIALLSTSIFLMNYTEWIGAFYSAIAALLCLIHHKRYRHSIRAFWIISISTSFAIVLAVTQYLSIGGLEAFLDLAQGRLSERSGQTQSVRGSFYDLASHQYLLKTYARNYFPHLVMLFFSFLLLSLKKGQFLLKPLEILLVLLAFLPVLLHHIVFFQFTIIHELALLKTCFGISALIAIYYHRTMISLKSETSHLIRALPASITCTMLLLSIFFYYSHVITPAEYFSKRLGDEIKATSTQDETIFFKTTNTLGWAVIKAPNDYWVIAPQIHLYSGRCIQTVASIDEAKSHLQKYDKEKGVIYTIENRDYIIEKVERISIIPPRKEAGLP